MLIETMQTSSGCTAAVEQGPESERSEKVKKKELAVNCIGKAMAADSQLVSICHCSP